MQTRIFSEGTAPLSLSDRLTLVETAHLSHEAQMVGVNDTADQSIVGKLGTAPLIMGAVTITTTGGAAGAQSYVVVAILGSGRAPSATAVTTTGPTTLDATHFNTLTWAAVPFAQSYSVYRTVGGAAQGVIATGVTALTVVDNALVATVATTPALNSTAVLRGAIQVPVQVLAADGAIAMVSGSVLITKGTAAAITLAAPLTGSFSAGGEDGCILRITDTTGAAHTVTTPANKINLNKHIATFGATVNNTLVLVASAGIWYVDTLGGTTIS
jgi:hypothetical protein